MKFFQLSATSFLIILMGVFSGLKGFQADLPKGMLAIMHQPKYEHAIWGLYVKDLQTGKIMHDLNSEKLFSPASTTKLFSVSALLQTFGDDYRFKTPIYGMGKIEAGVLKGNLILVAQGDLTMGGRQSDIDQIAFTKMDHTIANEVPGAILTKQDPLNGLKNLAKQVSEKGIKEIHGNILIDDRLFQKDEKRGTFLTPIFINENLIDMVINPGAVGQSAVLTWRPQVPGYSVTNELISVGKGEPLLIEITSDPEGHHILVRGTVSIDQKDLVRTFSIKDPAHFAREGLIQALEAEGIKLKLTMDSSQLPSNTTYQELTPLAIWVSPPLSEYAKLILKVSHNTGANLIPLLLASRKGMKTFDEGMQLIGDFVTQEVKLPLGTFVFIDAAGGNENRLTPQAEVQLLEYMFKKPPEHFKRFLHALPILGVDGSLEDFAKGTVAVEKVYAKPGTGVAYNTSVGRLFLITQALSGYVLGENGHLYAYMLAVNNGNIKTIDDVIAVFEDVSQLSLQIYDQTYDR